jgi:protease II
VKKATAVIVAIAAMLAMTPAGAMATEITTIAQNLTTVSTLVSPDGQKIVFMSSRNTEEATIPMISVYSANDGTTKNIDYPNPVNFGIEMTYASSNKFFSFVSFDAQNSNPNSLNFVKYDAMTVQTVPNVKGNIIKLCTTGNYIVWLENGLSEKCSVMAKDVENTSDPMIVASVYGSNASSMSLYAFEYDNVNYVLFDDKSEKKSAICLYNLKENKLVKLADSDFVESNPRYQAGRVFFTKSTVLDPNYFEANLAGGTIQSVSLDGQDTKNVQTFDNTVYPILISNINNPTNFIFMMLNKNDYSTVVRKYEIAANSTFDALKVESGSFVALAPESCLSNNIICSQMTMRNESSLYAYDFINSKKTVISDTKDIKVFSGIVSGKVAYVAVELAGATPREKAVSAIKLMLASF